jgi:hypothetical protein
MLPTIAFLSFDKFCFGKHHNICQQLVPVPSGQYCLKQTATAYPGPTLPYWMSFRRAERPGTCKLARVVVGQPAVLLTEAFGRNGEAAAVRVSGPGGRSGRGGILHEVRDDKQDRTHHAGGGPGLQALCKPQHRGVARAPLIHREGDMDQSGDCRGFVLRTLPSLFLNCTTGICILHTTLLVFCHYCGAVCQLNLILRVKSCCRGSIPLWVPPLVQSPGVGGGGTALFCIMTFSLQAIFFLKNSGKY